MKNRERVTEVLALIGALVLVLLIALFASRWSEPTGVHPSVEVPLTDLTGCPQPSRECQPAR